MSNMHQRKSVCRQQIRSHPSRGTCIVTLRLGVGKRPTSRSAGSDAERHHAVAILLATVLSLSNFSLFRLKACCRQSSRLLHAWCSGNRCCNDQSVQPESEQTGQRTVPQKSERQWGQLPIMRNAAWLHCCSPWNWQRFLAGMMCVRRRREGAC